MTFSLLDETNRVLPGFCKPMDGEVLSSWLARLAFRHGISTPGLCRLLFKTYHTINRDIDRGMRREHIPLLAERTNSTNEQVEATTLFSYRTSLFMCKDITFEKEPWLLPGRWLYSNGHRYYHFSTGLLFCPLCLKKHSYYKKEWRLALSFVCIECGCYLVDCCPHCGRGNSFMEDESKFKGDDVNQYMRSCQGCGKDITECEPCVASIEVLNLQKHLYDIMEYSSVGVPYIKESYLKVLHAVCTLLLRNKLKLKNLASDVFCLNDLFYRSIEHKQLRLLNTEQRSDVIVSAHWLLQKWPERFLNLCRNNFLHRDEVLVRLPLLPSWFIDPIIYGLNYKTQVKPKDKTRKFVEYTAKRKKMPRKTMEFDIEHYIVRCFTSRTKAIVYHT